MVGKWMAEKSGSPGEIWRTLTLEFLRFGAPVPLSDSTDVVKGAVSQPIYQHVSRIGRPIGHGCLFIQRPLNKGRPRRSVPLRAFSLHLERASSSSLHLPRLLHEFHQKAPKSNCLPREFCASACPAAAPNVEGLCCLMALLAPHPDIPSAPSSFPSSVSLSPSLCVACCASCVLILFHFPSSSLTLFLSVCSCFR